MDNSVRVLGVLGVIMFFWKDPPQTEGRRHADHMIKTPPGVYDIEFTCSSPGYHLLH